MGLQAPAVEEDEALRLCRKRKDFVRQAIDGSCSLTSAHTSYLASLRNTGSALRVFFEAEVPIGSSPLLYASNGEVAESLALMKGSTSLRLSTFSPSPDSSPEIIKHSVKSREVPPVSSVPPDLAMKLGGLSVKGSDASPGYPPWDYFGLNHQIDRQFSIRHGQKAATAVGRVAEEGKSNDVERDSPKSNEEGEEEGEEYPVPSAGGSGDTTDEFNSPALGGVTGRSDDMKTPIGEFEDGPSFSSTRTTETETEFYNGNKFKSPCLTPMREAASVVDVEQAVNKEDPHGAADDFLSSIKEIDFFFTKASESGKEVLMLLGADKFQFRRVLHGQERKGKRSPFSCLTACFDCEEEGAHEPIREENPENAVKYLTWHRTSSYRTSPSKYPIASNEKPMIDNLDAYRFQHFCLIHGDHASTLDRLYAWERKLYDEVKASSVIRRKYDLMCKVLRDKETREQHSKTVYETRAIIKDLHSRIKVAIQRIDSVSKRIEELRDRELEPQLEELIEALRRMWQVMFECHDRQVTLNLENELNSLSASFAKWISSQRLYLRSINDWLSNCVLIPQKATKRKRKAHPPSIKDLGPPPIYVTCADWLSILESLPTKEVKDSIKALAVETSGFLPRSEKGRGQSRGWPHSILSNAKGGNTEADFITHEAPEEAGLRSDRFRSALSSVINSLNEYARASVEKYTELQAVILEAKTGYENHKR
ncbi:hypothetical protein MLD38_008179 [Melastoma candidum]|uniref:Uncharacterized protein n=1 Tax=Melastoma candidum TaxID=119954 RepID=A0ACB9RT36_9MYRT|nr:hypothetical protein MLD38_008179 [Melastoma candidum]